MRIYNTDNFKFSGVNSKQPLKQNAHSADKSCCDFSLFPDRMYTVANFLKQRGNLLHDTFVKSIDNQAISTYTLTVKRYNDGSSEIREFKQETQDYNRYRFDSNGQLENVLSHSAKEYIDTKFDFTSGRFKYDVI